MCELLGRIREMLMWEFLPAFSMLSAGHTSPDCFGRQGRGQESFRDVFLIRHADVAVEVRVRVSRTSPDMVLDAASSPGSVYVCMCVCVCVCVCYGARQRYSWTGPQDSGCRAPRISRQPVHEGCKPYAPAAFITKEISPVLISVRERVDPRDVVRPEELRQ
jgi:hypothetical protein